jgi:hypothetical protein
VAIVQRGSVSVRLRISHPAWDYGPGDRVGFDGKGCGAGLVGAGKSLLVRRLMSVAKNGIIDAPLDYDVVQTVRVKWGTLMQEPCSSSRGRVLTLGCG